jgi:hypothetical protein
VESTASEASTKAAAMETPTAKAAAMESATTKAAAVEAATAKAASVTAATTAASGRRGWLNQADSHQCEQGYNRFPHHASFLGTMSPPRVKHFRTVIIRQSKSVRGKLTVSQGSSIILRMHPNVRADFPYLCQPDHVHRRRVRGVRQDRHFGAANSAADAA